MFLGLGSHEGLLSCRSIWPPHPSTATAGALLCVFPCTVSHIRAVLCEYVNASSLTLHVFASSNVSECKITFNKSVLSVFYSHSLTSVKRILLCAFNRVHYILMTLKGIIISIFFLLQYTKEDFLKKVDYQTTLNPIHFHCMNSKPLNIFCCGPPRKESHKGL